MSVDDDAGADRTADNSEAVDPAESGNAQPPLTGDGSSSGTPTKSSAQAGRRAVDESSEPASEPAATDAAVPAEPAEPASRSRMAGLGAAVATGLAGLGGRAGRSAGNARRKVAAAGRSAATGLTAAGRGAATGLTAAGRGAATGVTAAGRGAASGVSAGRRGISAAGRGMSERTAKVADATATRMAATKKMADRPRLWRAIARDRFRKAAAAMAASDQAVRAERAEATETARTAQMEAAAADRAEREAARQAAIEQKAMQDAARRRVEHQRTYTRLVAKDQARRRVRRRLLIALLIAPVVAATGLAVAAYYVDTIPSPGELALPESTTIYFSDGTTPMARLGTENRTILSYDEMNDAVKQSIVAAEDRTFWSNSGVDVASVVRAAWNNVNGGSLQGASTITQQYVRVAAGLSGITFARKTREAVLAWRMDHTYSKEKILEFYLNVVPFGRGAYGIEAAAETFFGKTARKDAPVADQVTVSEAMVLASLVKQPEPDPADPVGQPGYDPARGGTAAANAVMRWNYVRDGMVALGYLSSTEAAALEYPHTVRALDANGSADDLDQPTGLIVDHVLSELRQSEPFKGEPVDYIRNGGFRIVTTVDKRAQDAAEAAADITRVTAPAAVRGQPADWQAALVAVEPGTGRVLAYYGGNSGTGADYAGWYTDAAGNAVGYGEHRPGSSFKVYDLAEALRQGVSLTSTWNSPAVKEFPASGRTFKSPVGPVRNSSTAPCQPKCTLIQATVASLNVPFFDLTEHLGVGNVIDMATRAGIDSMWTDRLGPTPVRVDLRAHTGQDLVAGPTPIGKAFTTEVGIGQYGISVLDHANGMATFAAGGERAQAHFVRAVYQHGNLVYAEQLVQSSIGLTPAQVSQLTNVLQQVPSAKLANGWQAAGKTGTWEAAKPASANSDTWMVGYTRALAVAVWLGTKDGKALTTKDGSYAVFGSTQAAPIWRQFITAATAAMGLDSSEQAFPAAAVAASASASPSPTTKPTTKPSAKPTPAPTRTR